MTLWYVTISHLIISSCVSDYIYSDTHYLSGVVAKRIHEFEDSFKRISPAKRPRSSLHDQDRPDSDQSIPFAVVLDSEDNLELGESCGQSKLRGRDSMPIEDSTVNSIDEAENIETSGGGTGLYLGWYNSYIIMFLPGTPFMHNNDQYSSM